MPFVGRDRELATLLDGLRATAAGVGGVVLIAGEPGIGKTRLLRELADRARADGGLVLSGRAYESEGVPSYLPFAEALRPVVQGASSEELRACLGRGAADVALLLPEVWDRLPDLDPGPTLSAEHERYRLLQSVVDFILAIARGPNPPSPFPRREGGASSDRGSKPTRSQHAHGASWQRPSGEPPPALRGKGDGGLGLLLVLDDLHWADRPTLLLLQHLIRQMADAPLLVAGAYRTTGVGRDEPLVELLAELRREGLAQRLTLSSLTEADAGRLIAGMTGASPAPAVIERIHQGTEGNPFLLGEVVRQLHAERRDLGDPEALAAGWEVPQGVQEVVGRRLARLRPSAEAVLQAGAVLGEDFSLDLLAAVQPLGRDQLLDALDEALDAGMLRERGDRYEFAHSLTRQTVYDGLRLHRRQGLHLRAAEAIEVLHADDRAGHAGALAAHYRQAGSAGAEQALHYAQEAGRAAEASFAWEAAAGHWRAALDLLAARDRSDMVVRCELLRRHGTACMRAGYSDEGRAAFRMLATVARASSLGEPLATAALALSVTNAPPAETTGLLEEALTVLDERDSAPRARVLARLAAELPESALPERRQALADAAVAMARRLDDLHTHAAVLLRIAGPFGGPADAERRLAVSDEVVRIAGQVGNVELALTGHCQRLATLLELGDLAAADVAIEEHARLAEELRQHGQIAHTAELRAMRALLDGRLAEAEPLVDAARTIRQQGRAPVSRTPFTVLLFQLRLHQGRAAEVEPIVRAALEQLPRHALRRSALALLLSELGQVDAARRELERLAEESDGFESGAFAELRRDVLWLTALSLLGDACAAVGDRERAPTLYRLLAPYAGRCLVADSGNHCFGAAGRVLGALAATLGRWEQAQAHFEEALALNARIGARPWLARTREGYARMLLARGRRGDRRAAVALLEAALTLAIELGMEGLVRRVRPLLADPALTAAAAGIVYPDRLTAREVEVLRLIAAGLSNREIGERLVLSVRTVGRHIANIYTKIDAHNKADATAYVMRHRLIED